MTNEELYLWMLADNDTKDENGNYSWSPAIDISTLMHLSGFLHEMNVHLHQDNSIRHSASSIGMRFTYSEDVRKKLMIYCKLKGII